MTFLLTGIQVGQTVGVQVYISKTASPAFILIVCLGLLTAASQFRIGSMFENFILTGIGAICGYFLSYKVAFNLTSQDKWKFQALTSIRYITIGACVLILILTRTLSVPALIATVVMITGLLSIMNNSRERAVLPASKNIYMGLVTIFSGIALSLVYRNDINIVRDLYSGTVDFELVHNLLIAFSVVAAAAGFIVTNFVYTRFNDGDGALGLFNVKTFSFAYGLLLLGFFVAMPLFSFYVKILASTLIAITCPVFSAFLHLKSKSNIVYVIGAGSLVFAMFVLRPWLGMSPINAFLIYNMITLSCLYCVSVFCMAGSKQ
ncbi:hypothetical protein [Pseudomonas sp. R37(2017)]|uniref:hypothetical protein n=1 Tax=Pseudomonas sp. R37(2017) TaxID=1981685 RepID=UPI000A1E198F|nr:hypothetical protein [Pseudomonas sp. R37(2017)]